MIDEPSEARVRPLDAGGSPVHIPEPAARRGSVLTATAIALIVAAAIGAVIAWRAFVGSPFSAAEAVPADADLVVTMDFLQVRDVDRVDRFLRAFAEPMQRHGLIDEVTDLETVLREFDDLAEDEIGLRVAEDVLSWIGRSGSLAVWIPESLFALDTVAAPAPPAYLVSVDVRDQEAATDFLERTIAEADGAGVAVERIQVAGGAGYFIAEGPLVVTLAEGRFVLGDSVATVRRALELEPSASVAQRDDFQELASAIGGEPVMTFFGSSGLVEKASSAYQSLGMELPISQQGSGSTMAAVTLDDDGIAIRTAGRALEGLTVEPGTWAAALPAGTYGFLDVVLPDRYLAELSDMYIESLTSAGLTERDVADLTAPVDDQIGMSLLEDLLPQFGGEVMFAVVPARDGILPEQLAVDIGVLFGIGVDDTAIVTQALDRSIDLLRQQGVEVRPDNGMQVIGADGSTIGAVAVTDDSLFATSSPDALSGLLTGSGALAASERYRRVDDLIAGDGLAAFIDITALVDDFATDPIARDVLAPLVAIGAGYAVEGELQVTDVRILVDF